MMDKVEILTMCKKLARRYRNHQEYDDIVSEGVVVCLDLVLKGTADNYTLYNRARSAMSDYINVKSSHFSYPKGMRGREAAKSDTTEYVDLEDDLTEAEDIYGSFELKNTLEKLISTLDTKDKRVLFILYNNNNNLTETAKVLNLSKQRVEQIRSSIRDKLVTICELDK